MKCLFLFCGEKTTDYRLGLETYIIVTTRALTRHQECRHVEFYYIHPYRTFTIYTLSLISTYERRGA